MSERPDLIARGRAHRRLADAYPGVFARYLADECRSLGIAVPERRVAECGTRSGFKRHQRDGEPPCDSCRQAENAYQREWQRSRAVAGDPKEES